MSENTNYAIEVGEADHSRLILINEIYNPYSQEFLIRNGLKTGIKVLDMACGCGVMTRWIAEQVGPNGSVTAVDASAEQLAIAKETCAGYNNINYQQLSVYDVAEIGEKFDLVYTRFLLVHLSEPKRALQTLYSVLKPQGRLVCDDVCHSGVFFEPDNGLTKHFESFYETLFGSADKDMNYGRRLLTDMRSIGAVDIQYRFRQPILTSNKQKIIFYLYCKNVYSALIEAGIHEDEIARAMESKKAFADSNDSYAGCLIVCQAGGRKQIWGLP